MDYSQPDFYRFNTDSLLLVDYVLRRCGQRSFSQVADLGAGCGIVGIELLQKGAQFNQIDLIEYQKEYYPHLKRNIELFECENAKVHMTDFFELKNQYDLIISNPPYFSSEASRSSSNHNRNKCRIFSHGNTELFLEHIKTLLNPAGEAFVLVSRAEKFDIPFNEFSEFPLHKKISLLHLRLDK
ncbi:MAG: methyltransferase [Bacteriovoracaceae bacterium]